MSFRKTLNTIGAIAIGSIVGIGLVAPLIHADPDMLAQVAGKQIGQLIALGLFAGAFYAIRWVFRKIVRMFK